MIRNNPMPSFSHRSFARLPFAPRVMGFLAAALCIAALPLQAQSDAPRDKDAKDKDRSGHGQKDYDRKKDGSFSQLSQEDRERIRKALAEAWDDPEVIEARGQVHNAMEAYKQSLEKAVGKIDPEAVALMKEMHQHSRQEAVREKMGPPRFGGPGRPPANPKDLIYRTATNEPAYQEMDSAGKERFLALAEEIRRNGTLDEALSRFERVRDPKEYGQARGALREALVAAMKDADPWAKKAIEEAPDLPPRGERGPGGPDRGPGGPERGPRPDFEDPRGKGPGGDRPRE